MMNQDMMMQFAGMISMKRMRFSPEEDRLLDELVKNKKNQSWKEIAKNFPGRTAAQCRDRYNQYLFKKIENKPWTSEEDHKIVELYQEFGPHWVKIANFLPGRSGNNVKNHWNTALTNFHGIPYNVTKQERRSKKEKWTQSQSSSQLQSEAETIPVQSLKQYQTIPQVQIKKMMPQPIQQQYIDDDQSNSPISIKNLLAFNEVSPQNVQPNLYIPMSAFTSTINC